MHETFIITDLFYQCMKQTVPRVYSQNEVKQPVVVAERVSLRTTRRQGKTRARQSLLAQKYVK